MTRKSMISVIRTLFAFTGILIMLLASATVSRAQWSGSPNIYYNGGNVGVGTNNPQALLHVSSTSGAIENLDSSSTAGGFSAFYDTTSTRTVRGFVGFGPTLFGTGDNTLFGLRSQGAMTFATNGGYRQMTIDTSGNVGIGTPTPANKLDVNGTISANNIISKYQDVAEWVPSSAQLTAGTVVVLDSTKSNHVISSTVSYDTRVAGVVSEQPGIALGEKSGGRVLVATTGRVRVQVDASKGPIHIGDLLVTSDTPGVAMKSEPVNLGGVQIHRPGTLIGKALEPLEKGKGSILVLLSLQ